jgi:oligopeptide/dipeptide ABC transporter ATP-binding protein
MTIPVKPMRLLAVSNLCKTFQVSQGFLRTAKLDAVNDVTLSVERGATLAVVGESGSGKTTLARLIVGLLEASGGSVRFDGNELTGLSAEGFAPFRARIQMVFQDPQASLSPWQTIDRTVGEPLGLHTDLGRVAIRKRVLAMLERVGLSPDFADRYPHQLSGGQQQRVGIARALITSPSLVVLDEPTSSLDLSVQAQILSLLKSLQRELQLSYLFISHDLAAVRYIAHDIAVMYMGRLVEHGPAAAVLSQPAHPYTRALLAALPRPDPKRRGQREPLRGEPPSMLKVRRGCPFYGRCPIGLPACAETAQAMVPVAPRHLAACWRMAAPTGAGPDEGSWGEVGIAGDSTKAISP